MKSITIQDKVYDKMRLTAFESIVGDVFINAIPIDPSEMTVQTKKALSTYVKSAIESAGGFNLLEDAIDSTTNPFKRDLLTSIYNTCSTTAKRVSRRVALEAAAEKKPTKPLIKKADKSPVNEVVSLIRTASSEFRKTPKHRDTFNKYSRVITTFESEKNDKGVVVTVLKGDSSDFKYFGEFMKDILAYVNQKTEAVRTAVTIKSVLGDGEIIVSSTESKEAIESLLSAFEASDVPDDLASEMDTDKPDDNSEDLEKHLDGIKGYDDTDDDTTEAPVSTDPKDISLDARMTDDEYTEFISNKDSLDVSSISDIVNKKVIQTIQSEKEAYNKIADSNEKLKDALINDEQSNIDEEVVESVKENMLLLHMKNSSAKDHTSLFSKIQLKTIENLMMSNSVSFESVNAQTLTSVTVNDTFNIFAPLQKTFTECIKDAINLKAASESLSDDGDVEKYVTLGHAFATIIMTFIETLYTLNLMPVNTADVKDVVEKNNTVSKSIVTLSKDIDANATVAMELQERNINKTTNIATLEGTVRDLNMMKKKLADVGKNNIGVSESIVTKIDALITKAENKKTALESISTPDIGRFRQPHIDADKITINGLSKYFSKRNSDSISFKCIESADGAYVEVSAVKGNKPIYATSMALEGMSSALSIEDYVSGLIRGSSFKDITYDGVKPTLNVKSLRSTSVIK